jgi:hypothetical protein
LEELIGWLEGTEAASLTHAELEDELNLRGRELLRQTRKFRSRRC